MGDMKVVSGTRGSPDIPWQMSIDQSDAALARFVRALAICRAKVHAIAPDNGREIKRGGCLHAVVSLPLDTEMVFARQMQPISMSSWAQPDHGGGEDPHSHQRAFVCGHWDRRNKCFVVSVPSA